MTMNGTDVEYFKKIFQYSPGKGKENDDKSQSE
jgi:hypothetical protein